MNNTQWQSIRHCECINQCGMSLIEFFLALFLSTVLLMTLNQFYLEMKRIIVRQNALARVQERGRFALYFLAQRISMAGNTDCLRTVPKSIKQKELVGYSSRQLPSVLRRQVATSTDVIVIGACLPHQGRQKFIETAYYIGNTQRNDHLGKPIYSLFAKKLSTNFKQVAAPRVEVVSHVCAMNITYGIAQPELKDIASYQSADHITHWSAVHSVLIKLLISSSVNSMPNKTWLRYIAITRRVL